MDHGYTNIPDWVLSFDLDVYETIIYSVIYGFSQDGDSVFSGSISYLSRKAKCSRRKTIYALASLVDKEYIKKEEKDFRGMKLCEYRACIPCKGSARLAPGSAQSAPNNIDYNIDISKDILSIKKDKSFKVPTLEEVSSYCKERNNQVNPSAFIDFYESKGWKIGSTKMKDWKAAVRTWETRERRVTRTAPRKVSALEHNLKVADSLLGTDYYGEVYKKEVEVDEQ